MASSQLGFFKFTTDLGKKGMFETQG